MKTQNKNISRRKFLANSSFLVAGAALGMKQSVKPKTKSEPIIDIHQHIHYHGRTNKQMIQHQRNMGATQTILLPSGTPVDRAFTYWEASNGLGGVGAGGDEECYEFAQKHAGTYFFGVNEVPDLPHATRHIEKYLQRGAPIIAELKFGVACDSPGMQAIYRLAHTYNVPVLLHFQYHKYNFGYNRFYKMLEKYPDVDFLGHAQQFFANVGRNPSKIVQNYPKGKITPGGITDQLLGEYPNMYGNISAGSGLNFLQRDEDFTRNYLKRHQNKLIFGSDCADTAGHGNACDGAQIISTIKRLAPSKKIERKILYGNAKKMFHL
jgi:hypothetical protein